MEAEVITPILRPDLKDGLRLAGITDPAHCAFINHMAFKQSHPALMSAF
jgi:hypothetical protein